MYRRGGLSDVSAMQLGRECGAWVGEWVVVIRRGAAFQATAPRYYRAGGAWCRVESRLVAERRGRAGTGHGYRHTGSHPFTLLHHHQQKHQHLQHQHQRWYQHQHPAYWVMATRMPPLQYLPKPGLRHQHQLHSHPSNLFVSFPTSKVFVSRALIFSWQLDVAACCSLSCLRSHPHLTPVNCCCGTSTMARYCKPPSGMVLVVLLWRKTQYFTG